MSKSKVRDGLGFEKHIANYGYRHVINELLDRRIYCKKCGYKGFADIDGSCPYCHEEELL